MGTGLFPYPAFHARTWSRSLRSFRQSRHRFCEGLAKKRSEINSERRCLALRTFILGWSFVLRVSQGRYQSSQCAGCEADDERSEGRRRVSECLDHGESLCAGCDDENHNDGEEDQTPPFWAASHREHSPWDTPPAQDRGEYRNPRHSLQVMLPRKSSGRVACSKNDRLVDRTDSEGHG